MRLRLHRGVQPAINTPIATRLYRFDRIRCSNKGGLYFLFADQADFDALREIDVGFVQGYYIQRPEKL